MLFEGNDGDPLGHWAEEEAKRRVSTQDDAKRYNNLERPAGEETSGLKVSSVLSWKRKNSTGSGSGSASGQLDSSRSSLTDKSSILARSDTAIRAVNPYDMP
jgi:hypothetical protein